MPSTGITLDPVNPYDFEDGSLNRLAENLEGEIPGVNVRVSRRQEEGYGGPLPEVLAAWLDVSGLAGSVITVTTVTRALGKFLKSRWLSDRESCEEGQSPRVRVGIIYDRNGRVLKRISIESPTGNVSERANGDAAPRPLPEDGS